MTPEIPEFSQFFPRFPRFPIWFWTTVNFPRFTPNFPYDREINNIQKYSTWRSFLAFLVTLDFTNHYTIHAGMHLKVFAAQNGMPQVASDYYGLNCAKPICPRLTIANLRRCRLPHVAPDYYGLTWAIPVFPKSSRVTPVSPGDPEFPRVSPSFPEFPQVSPSFPEFPRPPRKIFASFPGLRGGGVIIF